MKLKSALPLLLVLILGILMGWLLFDNGTLLSLLQGERSSVQVPVESVEDAGAQRQPVPPRYPVPPPEEKPPAEMPSTAAKAPVEPPFPVFLDEGDAYLKQRLPQLITRPELLRLLSLEHFIQKLVLIIDQLPGKAITRKYLPINPPPAGFTTSGRDDQLVIAAKNAERYHVYVELAEAIPDPVLLHLYRGLYPLFQQAYRELGNPEGYFNDRLIEVIDHLLDTPEPKEPIPLDAHVSRFRYADPSLEALSAGQKILLRMGNDNARRVKAKLARLRGELMRRE